MQTIYRQRRKEKARGFSLIELMVSMGILTILMLMLTVLLGQVQESWRFSQSRISQFREARVAFDLMTKNLAQASLNTYLDLEVDNQGLVEGYRKTSELHFLTIPADKVMSSSGSQRLRGHAVFFQAPLGFSSRYRNLNNLFNARGYFVTFGGDRNFRPRFIDSAERMRFRLMEFRPPAEGNGVFQDGMDEREAGNDQQFDDWYRQKAAGISEGDFESHLNPLAENIVTLIVSPRSSLAKGSKKRDKTFGSLTPNFEYDSNDLTKDYSNEIPPLVRLSMVAIDEASAVRLEDGTGMPDIIPQGLFQRADNYEDDVRALATLLNDRNINYKVFSATVMLRGSKWTGEATNTL